MNTNWERQSVGGNVVFNFCVWSGGLTKNWLIYVSDKCGNVIEGCSIEPLILGNELNDPITLICNDMQWEAMNSNKKWIAGCQRQLGDENGNLPTNINKSFWHIIGHVILRISMSIFQTCFWHFFRIKQSVLNKVSTQKLLTFCIIIFIVVFLRVFSTFMFLMI